MKKIFLFTMLVISLFLLYEFLVNDNVPEAKTSASEPSAINDKETLSVLKVDNKAKEDKKPAISELSEDSNQSSTSENYNKFLDYDDDWCTVQQIPPENRTLARIEMNDWNESIGKYSIGDPRIKQYSDMSTDGLLQQVEDENPMAMLHALGKVGVYSYEEKDELGRQMLVIGHTGQAIESLVINEIAQVLGKYERGRQDALNEDVKKHLHQAFVYASYSANLFDLNGYVQLVHSMSRKSVFETDLDPNFVFSDSEIKDIVTDADRLEKWVTSQRANRGLPPINRSFGKTAKRDFDSKLGLLYATSPSLMTNLTQKFGSEFSKLEATECSYTYKTLYAQK
jgi:hypothetical protein